jgi:GcrA cell cycle regulator
MLWTDERIELLRVMWLDGKSAAEISRALGPGVSRNAVIGKTSRLGLMGHARTHPPILSKCAETASAPSFRSDRRTAARAGAPSAALAVQAESSQEPSEYLTQTIVAVIAPLSKRATFEELEAGMCKWPLGDPLSPEFRYCGAAMPDKASYCAYHQRLARKPEQDRRHDRPRPSLKAVSSRSIDSLRRTKSNATSNLSSRGPPMLDPLRRNTQLPVLATRPGGHVARIKAPKGSNRPEKGPSKANLR